MVRALSDMIRGHRVMVTGIIEMQPIGARKVLADPVYDYALGTHFCASAASGGAMDPRRCFAGPFNHAPRDAYTGEETIFSISGTISAIAAREREFTLDTGIGQLQVDTGRMRDNPLDALGRPRLRVGDRVTASGALDDADYFYANAADEEITYAPFPFAVLSVDVPSAGIAGTVHSIDGRTFALDVGGDSIRVDTGDMGYNPMAGPDAVGSGDRVVVYGTLDDAEFFDRREIQATSILTLSRNGAAGDETAPGDEP